MHPQAPFAKALQCLPSQHAHHDGHLVAPHITRPACGIRISQTTSRSNCPMRHIGSGESTVSSTGERATDPRCGPPGARLKPNRSRGEPRAGRRRRRAARTPRTQPSQSRLARVPPPRRMLAPAARPKLPLHPSPPRRLFPDRFSRRSLPPVRPSRRSLFPTTRPLRRNRGDREL